MALQLPHWKKYFLYKHEDLSSDPYPPYKKLAGQGGTERWLTRLTGQPAESVGEIQDQ